MPVIRSAKKKLRKDIKREKANNKIRISLDKVLKEVKKHPSAKLVASATSALDKAAKKNIIHKNKASRIKSKLSKLLTSSKTKQAPQASKKIRKNVSK